VRIARLARLAQNCGAVLAARLQTNYLAAATAGIACLLAPAAPRGARGLYSVFRYLWLEVSLHLSDVTYSLCPVQRMACREAWVVP
jgi:hypothetical protein